MAHTDSARTHSLVSGVRGRDALLQAHLDNLHALGDGRAMWYPTFNYDYLRSGVYSVPSDESQVGVINESLRKSSLWRTSMPVFNFAGRGLAPYDLDPSLTVVLPFDGQSVFAQSVELDGVVLWYGAPIHTATVLHHAEWIADGPLYRYDKDFAGRIDSEDGTRHVRLRYHVRPLGRSLDYDWPRITSDAVAEGVIQTIREKPVQWASVRALVGYWAHRMNQDPLYLLDGASRAWVEPQLERLGRRFELADFETKE